MDEKFVQGVVGGVLKRHENLTLDSKRIQTLMVEIAANIELVSKAKKEGMKELEQKRNYDFKVVEYNKENYDRYWY